MALNVHRIKDMFVYVRECACVKGVMSVRVCVYVYMCVNCTSSKYFDVGLLSVLDKAIFELIRTFEHGFRQFKVNV